MSRVEQHTWRGGEDGSKAGRSQQSYLHAQYIYIDRPCLLAHAIKLLFFLGGAVGVLHASITSAISSSIYGISMAVCSSAILIVSSAPFFFFSTFLFTDAPIFLIFFGTWNTGLESDDRPVVDARLRVSQSESESNECIDMPDDVDVRMFVHNFDVRRPKFDRIESLPLCGCPMNDVDNNGSSETHNAPTRV